MGNGVSRKIAFEIENRPKEQIILHLISWQYPSISYLATDETKKPGRGRPSKAEMERRAKEKEENGEIEVEEKDSTTTKPEGEEKLFKFPLGTVKRIIKMDPDVNVISKDSIFLITKALEMFVESLSIEAYSYTAGAKKKTLSKQDVEKAIDAVDALAFLDGALDD